MKALEAWLVIVEKCKNTTIDVLTDKKLRDVRRWFSVSSNGIMLMLSEAVFKTPKADFKQPVLVTRQEFEMIFPFYFKQERVNKMAGVWPYQDYIFALIRYFCFSDNPELNMMLNEDESEKDSVGLSRENREAT